ILRQPQLSLPRMLMLMPVDSNTYCSTISTHLFMALPCSVELLAKIKYSVIFICCPGSRVCSDNNINISGARQKKRLKTPSVF
ncbi:MAG: hypothetical protein GX999_11925, partial [Bacteroidales bacterium]|nr:hypothetical protein [Bacteroidales bacterium]